MQPVRSSPGESWPDSMQTQDSQSSYFGGLETTTSVLTAPAVETQTGSLLFEAITDGDILLKKALSIRDALDEELLRLPPKIDYDSTRDMQRVHQNYLHELAGTPAHGWVTAGKTLRLNCDWLNDIARSIIRNRPVEIQVAHATQNPVDQHRDDPDCIYDASLTSQAPGFAIAAMLRRIRGFEYVRPVVVVDDIKASANNERGAMLHEYAVKSTYGHLLLSQTIASQDVPGKDFIIIPKSTSILRSVEAFEQLEASDIGFLAHYTDGRVFLRPNDRVRDSVSHQYGTTDNAAQPKGVLLYRTDGTPTEALLQAATYLDPINSLFTHLRVHDARHLYYALGDEMHPCKHEQNVSVLLQSLDISHPDRDQNIYYSSYRDSPHKIMTAFAFLLRREVQEIIDSLNKLDDVRTAMKPKDYFEHNYCTDEGIWPEDLQGIRALAAELPLHFSPGEIESAAVIGYGPFSYPALGIAPFMKEGSSIDISDLLPTNIAFAEEWFSGTAGAKHDHTYTNFGNQFRKSGKSSRFYENCEQALRLHGNLHTAALEDLPSASAQVAMESFVSCSNNIEKYGFYETIRQKARIMTWTNRSMMISVHMVKSGGWNNSGDEEGITIPAAKLSIEDIQDGYRAAGLRIVKCTPLHANAAFRKDYSGMVIVFARPDTIERPRSLPH